MFANNIGLMNDTRMCNVSPKAELLEALTANRWVLSF